MPHGHGAEPKSHVDKRNGPPIEIGRLISCQKSRLFMLMSRHFYQFVLVLVSLVSCHLLVPTVRYHGPCTNYWATITVGRNCSRCIRSGIKEKGWTSSRLNMLLPLSSVPDSVARRTEAAKYTALQHCQIRWLFLGLYKHLSHISQVVLWYYLRTPNHFHRISAAESDLLGTRLSL